MFVLCAQKRMDSRVPDVRSREKAAHIAASHQRQRELNAKFNAALNQEHLSAVKAARQAMGDAWPRGIWTMDQSASQSLWQAMRVRLPMPCNAAGQQCEKQ